MLHESCPLLGYYAAFSGNSLPTFHHPLRGGSEKSRIIKHDIDKAASSHTIPSPPPPPLKMALQK